jgi:hypothetical protein
MAVVTAALLRLLTRRPLGANVVLGPEDRQSMELADRLRVLSLEGRFRGVFFHVPNEVGYVKGDRRAQLRYAKAIAMGCIPGTPDFVFLGKKPLVIEMKAKTGRQTESQADFEYWCGTEGVEYRICRSAAEALTVLRAFEFIEG